MPDDCFILYYLANASMGKLDYEFYPLASAADKPSRDIIMEKTREAFHKLADQARGPEWADSLTIRGHLWKAVIDPVTGNYYNQPVWVFLVYDPDGKNSGSILLDGDGKRLSISVRPDTGILPYYSPS